MNNFNKQTLQVGIKEKKMKSEDDAEQTVMQEEKTEDWKSAWNQNRIRVGDEPGEANSESE